MSPNLKAVRGSVKLISCSACNSKVPLFVFEGETDVDTVGLCSVGRCGSLEIAIAELNLGEWTEFTARKSEQLPSRLNKDLEGEDYRAVHVLRVENSAHSPPGISFAEFRKLYRPPQVIYSCPCCGKGEGVESAEWTVAGFKEMGGQIHTLGNLTLAE